MNSYIYDCPIWGQTNPMSQLIIASPLQFHVQSPRAGGSYEFYLPNFGLEMPKWTLSGDNHNYSYVDRVCRIMSDKVFCSLSFDEKILLSRKICESLESPFEITPKVLKEIKKEKIPDVKMKVALLGKILSRMDDKGKWLPRQGNRGGMAAICVVDDMEVAKLERALERDGLLKIRGPMSDGSRLIKILPKLRETFPVVSQDRNLSESCFVAMSFHKTWDKAYNKAIKPGIENAGYEAVRVDFTHHTHKIDDEIVVLIRRSKFIVADLTDQNLGVYYESGFAHGSDKQVIYTCEETHMEDVHFDINHYNILKWKKSNPSQFAQDLQNRIEAIFGAGGYKAGESK